VFPFSEWYLNYNVSTFLPPNRSSDAKSPSAGLAEGLEARQIIRGTASPRSGWLSSGLERILARQNGRSVVERVRRSEQASQGQV